MIENKFKFIIDKLSYSRNQLLRWQETTLNHMDSIMVMLKDELERNE